MTTQKVQKLNFFYHLWNNIFLIWFVFAGLAIAIYYGSDALAISLGGETCDGVGCFGPRMNTIDPYNSESTFTFAVAFLMIEQSPFDYQVMYLYSQFQTYFGVLWLFIGIIAAIKLIPVANNTSYGTRGLIALTITFILPAMMMLAVHFPQQVLREGIEKSIDYGRTDAVLIGPLDEAVHYMAYIKSHWERKGFAMKITRDMQHVILMGKYNAENAEGDTLEEKIKYLERKYDRTAFYD